MISFVPHAAGSAGGIVPAAPLTPPPAVDGFDALLGQISASLLATVGEALAGAAPPAHGPGASEPAETETRPGHAGDDPVAWPLALPIVTPPHIERPLPAPSVLAGEVGSEPAVADITSATGVGLTPATPPTPSDRSAPTSRSQALSRTVGEHARVMATSEWSTPTASAESGGHVPFDHANQAFESAAFDAPPAPSAFASQGSDVSPAPVPFAPTATGSRGELRFESTKSAGPGPRRDIDVPTVEVAATATSPQSPTALGAEHRSPGWPTPVPVDTAHGASVTTGHVPLTAEPVPGSMAVDVPHRPRRLLGSFEPVSSLATSSKAVLAGARPSPVGPEMEASEPVASGRRFVVSTETSRTEQVRGDTTRGGLVAPVATIPAPVVPPVVSSVVPSVVPPALDEAGGSALVAQAGATMVGEDAVVAKGHQPPDLWSRRPARLSVGARGGPMSFATSEGATPEAAPALDQTPPLLAATHAWRAMLATIDQSVVTPAPAAVPLAGVSSLVAPAVLVAPRIDDSPMAIETTPVDLRTFEAPTGDSIQSQIVRSLRLQWTGGLGEARVTLKPEFLGEVVATITVERGVVTAALQADSPDVRRWIETHSASLRDALVEHGLKLDRLTVAEPAREPADADRQGRSRARQQEPPPRPRRRAPEGETAQFDVTP